VVNTQWQENYHYLLIIKIQHIVTGNMLHVGYNWVLNIPWFMSMTSMYNSFLRRHLVVEALKISGSPYQESSKCEGGRREGKRDGNWLGRLRTCRRCSPYWLRCLKPAQAYLWLSRDWGGGSCKSDSAENKGWRGAIMERERCCLRVMEKTAPCTC
jgi:hypothetical protein